MLPIPPFKGTWKIHGPKWLQLSMLTKFPDDVSLSVDHQTIHAHRKAMLNFDELGGLTSSNLETLRWAAHLSWRCWVVNMYRVGIHKKWPEHEGVLYVLFHLGLKWPLKQWKGYFEEAGSWYGFGGLAKGASRFDQMCLRRSKDHHNFELQG